MVFKVTYQQVVTVICSTKETALELLEKNMPFIKVCGASGRLGGYELDSDKFTIIDIRMEDNA